MEPLKHYTFNKWAKFLETKGHTCFLQVRAMDGSYFEVNINNHEKSNLLLGDEIEKSDGEIEKK